MNWICVFLAALILTVSVGLVSADDEWENKDAVQLAKEGNVASLGTIDKDKKSYVSLTPYALDEKGRPFVYISTLAYHTKNLDGKPESSLMVAKPDDDDIFNSARLTFMGEMKLVEGKKDIAALKKIYFAKYKKAKELDKFHDFGFYRMETVDKLHYIGGFGDIRWIKGKDWLDNYK